MKGPTRVTDDTGWGPAAGGSGTGPKRSRRAPQRSAETPRAASGAAPTPAPDDDGPDDGHASASDGLAPRGRLRQLVGGVVLAEGIALVAAGGFLVLELFRATPTETGGAIAQVVVALVTGLGLLLLARGALAADERARVPVLVWQVLQVSIGVPAMSSNRVLAVLLLATAGVAGVGVLVPGVLRPDARGLADD